jgi:hypothetical protein
MSIYYLHLLNKKFFALKNPISFSFQIVTFQKILILSLHDDGNQIILI